MKKIFLILFAVFYVVAASANGFAVIEGKCTLDDVKEIKLLRYSEGWPVDYATSALAPDGTFGIMVKPDEKGFYSINCGSENYHVFLQHNDRIKVEISSEGCAFSGKLSKENRILAEWEKIFAPLRIYYNDSQATYKQFFPALDKVLTEKESWAKKAKTGNSAFDKYIIKLAGYDVDYIALRFIESPRNEFVMNRNDYPEFYKSITTSRINDASLLDYPAYSSLLNYYVTYDAYFADELRPGIRISVENILMKIQNDTIRAAYLLPQLDRVSIDPQMKFVFDTYMDMYGSSITTPEHKERLGQIIEKMEVMKDGSDAIDFTYPDVTGNMVSLFDFRGKLVFIDVWATWCGPCKQEIPALKKLHEEFKNNDNVVFVSVSVDKEEDKQKWLDFVKENDLPGVQLFASGWSKIAQDYGIKGIPRFIIIGKNGKIVSYDAPRPSSAASKELIINNL